MGFLTHFWAATPENPRFSLQDPAAWDMLGAQPSTSGVRVTRDTALSYSPYYRGISLITGLLGRLPLIVYKRQGNGKAPDPSHQAYAALLHKPNPELTAFPWKRTMQAHALDSGNGYSYINRRGDGSIDPERGLVLLDPKSTFPIRVNGRFLYTTRVGSEQRTLLPEDVFHIPGLSFDGMTGLSVTEKATEVLGGGIGAQRYGHVFFKNDAKGSFAVCYPNKIELKTLQSLRESLERGHSGLENKHKMMLFDNGAQIKELSIDAQKAQLIELLQHNRVDVANFLDLPAFVLGDASATSYNSLEILMQALLDLGLETWLTMWQEQARDKLFTEEEKADDSHLVEFDRKHLIKANMQARASYWRTALGGQPWAKVNEARADEGLEPSDDPKDEEIQQPANMGGGQNDPADGTAPAEPPPRGPAKKGASAELVAAHRAALAATAGRMTRRVGVHARRAAADPQKFMAWLDLFGDQHHEVITDALAPNLFASNAALSLHQSAPDTARQLLNACRESLLEAAGEATARQLPATVAARMGRLEAELPGWLAAQWAYDPDQERDDSGRFGSGSGSGSGDKSDEDLEKERDREDADVDAKHAAEDQAVEDRRGKEDEAMTERHAGEKEAHDADREKATDALDARHAKEDTAQEKAHAKEDRGLEKAHEKENDKADADQDREGRKIESAREKEDVKTDAVRDKEDKQLDRQRDQEDAAEEAQKDKEIQEGEDKKDRDYEEHQKSTEGLPQEERDRREAEYLKEREPRDEAEEDAFITRWGDREDALAAKREQEDNAISERRNEEDGQRDERREAEDKTREDAAGNATEERTQRQEQEAADRDARHDREREDLGRRQREEEAAHNAEWDRKEKELTDRQQAEYDELLKARDREDGERLDRQAKEKDTIERRRDDEDRQREAKG